MTDPAADSVLAARARRLELATGAELRGWQELAGTWPLRFCLDDPYARCEACDQAVIRLVDDYGAGYLYSPAEVLTLMVAHIRQNHAAGGLSALSPFPLAWLHRTAVVTGQVQGQHPPANWPL